MNNILNLIIKVSDFFASLTREQDEAVVAIVIGCLALLMLLPQCHDILSFKRYSKRFLRLKKTEVNFETLSEKMEMELFFRWCIVLFMFAMSSMIIAAGIMYLTL